MKKLTSILILICMILSLFSFHASAAETITATAPEGVSAEDYGILNALGVINADLWSDGTVTTRAEFIQLCVNLTKCDNVKAMETVPVFTDLTTGHWAYDAIMYAYNMGYAPAYSDGTIKPDSPITFGEAIQILTNFLGYQIVAASYNNGDLISAYHKTGFDIGLLAGVVSDGLNMPLIKSSAVRMAYNALDIELPVQYFSNNNVFFNVQSDRTLLRVKFNAYRAKGVVRADDYISLSHNLTRENYISIDGVNYYSANVNTDGLIGCTALYYYKQNEENDEKELLYINPVDTEITVVPAEELNGYSNMKINTITSTGKKVSYKIGKDTTVIWNNKIITSAEYANKFKVKSGSAKLIDNDGDGEIEVVIIESLKAAVVAVNDSDEMVIKFTDGTVYDLDDYKNYRIENRYGEKIDPVVLHVDDVVTIADSGSKNHTLVIRVCKKNDIQIVGSVDEEGYVLVGDGSELKYSNTAASSYDELIIGDSYIFYTDKHGEIVYAIHVRANDLEIVYLVTYKQQTGMDSNLVLKVMHTDGTITNMDGARNIKIRDKNGNFSVKKADGIITMLNQGKDAPLRQPVMLRTNATGFVSEIYMLASTDRKDLIFHEIVSPKVGGSGKRWYQPAYTFHNVIQIKSATPVLAVPHSTRTDVDDDEFFVGNYRMFKGTVYYPESGDNAYYQIPIGMEKDAIAADYLVWEYPKNAEARAKYLNTTYKGIVTKISKTIDENGDEFVKVTFATTAGLFGNTVMYKQTNGDLDFVDDSGRKVNVGDFVIMGVDYFGHADEASVKTVYDYKNDLIISEGDSSTVAFYGWRAVRGTIKEKSGSYIRVENIRPTGEVQHQVLDLASAITINCNVGDGLFSKDRAPSSLLAEGDSYLMILSGALPVTLLIYE